jgi:manganese-dependent inorganic pyrophosphatase
LRGLDAEVVALGEVNEETAFALDYFGVTAPRVVTSAKSEGVDTVILTDHNEFQQSISDIRDVTIMGVVDHHRVANFETEAPLFMTLSQSVQHHLSFTVSLNQKVVSCQKQLLACSCQV